MFAAVQKMTGHLMASDEVIKIPRLIDSLFSLVRLVKRYQCMKAVGGSFQQSCPNRPSRKIGPCKTEQDLFL
jgi:hypothetical protein